MASIKAELTKLKDSVNLLRQTVASMDGSLTVLLHNFRKMDVASARASSHLSVFDKNLVNVNNQLMTLVKIFVNYEKERFLAIKNIEIKRLKLLKEEERLKRKDMEKFLEKRPEQASIVDAFKKLIITLFPQVPGYIDYAKKSAVNYAKTAYQALPPGIQSNVKKFLPVINAFGKGIKAFGKSFKSMFNSMFLFSASMLLMQLLDAINPFKPLLEALTDIFSTYGEILSIAFMPVVEKLYDVLLDPKVITALMNLSIFVANFFNAILYTSDLLSGKRKFMQYVQADIESLFSNDDLRRIQVFLSDAKTVMGEVIELQLKPIRTLKTAINGLVGSMKIKSVEDFFQAIPKGVGVMLQGMVKPINSIIDWGNKYLKLNMGRIEVPVFGQGGIVSQPMLSVVGDVPEAIIPLDRLQEIQGNTVNITIQGDITEERLFDLKRELWRSRI